LLFALLSLGAAPAFSQVKAFVVPRPLGGAPDPLLLRVLAAALQVELMRAGLEVQAPDPRALVALAAASPQRLLAEAREADADFLFLEGYTSTGQTLEVEIEVLAVDSGQRIGAAEASGKIDLRLDEAVSAAADKLLPSLETHIAAARSRRQEALAAEAPEAVALTGPAEAPAETPAETAPAAPEEPVEPGPPAEEPAAAALPAEEPAAPEPPAPAAPSPPRRWELSVGGAPFFPVAQMTDLFTLGWQATACLDYRVDLAALALAFGGYAGYESLVPAAAGTASYFRSLVPFGADLRVGSPQRGPLGVYVRVQAGAALNVSPQETVYQRLTRVLPQVKAGAGVNVAFTRRLGLAVELLYELLLYLYQDGGALAVEPVMGFDAPSAYLYVRW